MEHWKILGPVSDKEISEWTFYDFILVGPKAESGLNSKYPYLERVYTNLPPHKIIGITGVCWYYEKNIRNVSEPFASLSIDSGHDFELLSVLPSQRYIKTFDEFKDENYYTNFANRFKYVSPHESSTLIFRVVSYVQEDPTERSFGFREVTIHFSNFSTMTEHSMMCHNSEMPIPMPYNQTLNECPCLLNQALDSNQICQSCAEKCDVCFGPEPSQCLACAYGTHWDGKKCNKCHPNCQTCYGPDNKYGCQVCTFGFYNYKNGTCSETCESPFQKVKGITENYCRRDCKPDEYEWSFSDDCLAKCDFPLVKSTRENDFLTCHSPCSDSRDFVYFNGSCLSICPVPLLAVFWKGLRFCKNPCEINSDYLYSNHSCLKECPLPLQIKSEPGVNYCINPCNSTNLYLYNNGSCLENCHIPFKTRTEFGVKYCQMLCDLTREFIGANGSCSQKCPHPLIQKKAPFIGTYCLSPCESENHFLSQNGSCLANCPRFSETRIEHGIKYCLSACLSDQYYFSPNKSCLNKCSYPLKATTNEGINLCESPCFEEAQFLGKDGNCRESCEYPFEASQKGSSKLCIISMTSSQLLQVDSIFKSIDISTLISRIGGVLSCLLHSGDPTSMLMMPLLNMFETVKETRIELPGNIGTILNHGHLKENFQKSLLFLGTILVITFLLKIIKLRGGWSIFVSGFLSISGETILFSFKELKKSQINVWTLICMLLTIFVLIKVLGRWRFVYEIYKSENIFIFIYLLRVILVNLILSFFSDHPQTQVFTLMGISSGMVFYLVFASPIQKTISKIQHMTTEVALLLYYTILLANFDEFGHLMAILYLITSFITSILIVYKLLRIIYDFYKKDNSRSEEHIELSQESSNVNNYQDDGKSEFLNMNLIFYRTP